MKWSILGLFVLGVIAATCVAAMMISLQSDQAAKSTSEAAPEEAAPAEEREEPEVPVLAAGMDMEARSLVTEDMIVIRSMKESLVPENSFSDPVQVVGKVLIVPMAEGQAFTASCFASSGPGFVLASSLPPGMRAVNVSLTDSMGMEKLLYPGSVVDVIATMKMENDVGKDELISLTLLQGALVLGVGNRTVVSPGEQGVSPASGRNRPSVTLLVEPMQAEMIKLAMQLGSVSLTLRNPMDLESHATGGTRITGLSPILAAAEQKQRARQRGRERLEQERLNGERSAVEEAPEDDAGAEMYTPPWEVLIIRGGEVERKVFADYVIEPRE